MESCAIYVRLSKEDQRKEGERINSESIENQKEILIAYALEHGFHIYAIYCDDDYSGMTTDRPAFNRLLTAAKQHNFTTILCKTQSRFTRDMEVAEKYINGYFLEWGIRFIAVSEQMDTRDVRDKKNMQIQAYMNEWYIEDLSENVKKTLHTLRKSGKWVSAFVCYGYQKDKQDKHHIVVDEAAAIHVRNIFARYIQGYGYYAIAKYLNAHHVLTPTQYKQATGSQFKNNNIKKYNIWTPSTVATILKNQFYTGCMIQGKRGKTSYKDHKMHCKDSCDWVVIPNTHEAIITNDEFQLVSLIRAKRSSIKQQKKPSMFTGKVACLQCGLRLLKKVDKKGKNYFICPSGVMGSKECRGVLITEEVLKNEILRQWHLLKKAYAREAFLLEKFEEHEHKALLAWNKENKHVQQQLQAIQMNKKQAYMNKLREDISNHQYQVMMANFIKDEAIIQEAIKALGVYQPSENAVTIIRNMLSVDIMSLEIAAQFLNTFVNTVEIGRRNEYKIMNIYWQF